MKRTKPPAQGYQITNCTFTNDAFVVNENVAAAVRALADAAAANARAIERIAERLTGPVDNRVALKIESPQKG